MSGPLWASKLLACMASKPRRRIATNTKKNNVGGAKKATCAEKAEQDSRMEEEEEELEAAGAENDKDDALDGPTVATHGDEAEIDDPTNCKHTSSTSSSSSSTADIYTFTTEALEGRLDFYDVLVTKNGTRMDKPQGQLQPLAYGGKSESGFRYGVRCKIAGHAGCSRSRRFEPTSGEEPDIVEQVLCKWIIDGFSDPNITDKASHMRAARH